VKLKKGLRVWKWPEFLHGRGHDFYDGKQAKELYGKQLVSLSEKVFWAMLAPIFGFFLNPEAIDLKLVMYATGVFLSVGLYFRHQGLKIIDELDGGKIKIITSSNIQS
jgi:hypothetical protein